MKNVYLFLSASFFGGVLTESAPAMAQHAIAGSAVVAPVFINLYWDAHWDADSPVTMQAIDGFTTALVDSSYFAGLTEYGVRSASFGGSFAPAAGCPSVAPARVGFWDPVQPSVLGFLQCEMANGHVPSGTNVIYNILLPPQSLESDLGAPFRSLGVRTFCTASSGNVAAMHFHGLPPPPFPPPPLAGPPFGATPLYTIVPSAPMCGSFTSNLAHEMVEAASDPTVPLAVLTSGGGGEIADLAEHCSGTAPWAIRTTSGSQFSDQLSLPSYWSNAAKGGAGACTTGFGDQTAPGMSLSIQSSGSISNTTFTLRGKGFGTLPPRFRVPSGMTLPYVSIQDRTAGWQAGDSVDGDALGLSLTSWSDNTLVIGGLSGVTRSGTFALRPADLILVQVCNPASGACTASNVLAPPGNYTPELQINCQVVPSTAGVQLTVDGTPASCATPLTLPPGSHRVTATASPGAFQVAYGGACSPQGQVTLAQGQGARCSVALTAQSVIQSSGCKPGQKCCDPEPSGCKSCIDGRASCP